MTRVIIENAILPRFRDNYMAGGIERGVDDAIQVISGDAAEIQKLAEKRPSDSGSWNSFLPVLFFIIVIIVINMLRRTGRRRGALGAILGTAAGWSLGRAAGRSWGSGGSSGGGGGFSGGGGSFGGGGSSGSW